ncbi:MAG: hypothetical protein G5Z42_00010 [Caldisphaeraceae archaeon]|nr:hypothetical protein [Caldisphaeraceae archaeon]
MPSKLESGQDNNMPLMEKGETNINNDHIDNLRVEGIDSNKIKIEISLLEPKQNLEVQQISIPKVNFSYKLKSYLIEENLLARKIKYASNPTELSVPKINYGLYFRRVISRVISKADVLKLKISNFSKDSINTPLINYQYYTPLIGHSVTSYKIELGNFSPTSINNPAINYSFDKSLNSKTKNNALETSLTKTEAGDIDEGLIEGLINELDSAGLGLSSVNDKGIHIWLYNYKGEDFLDFLSSIALEFMLNSGRIVNPEYIDLSKDKENNLLRQLLFEELHMKLKNSEGVFILEVKNKLSSPSFRKELIKLLVEVLESVHGNKLQYLIMPKDISTLSDEISKIIYEKPRELKEFDYEKINKLHKKMALISSAFNIDDKSLGQITLAKSSHYYYKLLDKLSKEFIADTELLKFDRPNLKNPNNFRESMDHRLLKRLAIYYLIRKKKISEIKVEEPCNEVVPDIKISDGNSTIIIDIKTSIGMYPYDEIFDVVEKYKQCSKNIWIVMRPLPALIYLKHISSLIKMYKKEEGINLKVLLPSIDEDRKPTLIRIDEAIKKAKNLIK